MKSPAPGKLDRCESHLSIPGVPTGDEVIRRIAAKTDTVLLAFSCGKDSIAAWLALRPHFKRIVPFHLYIVPGLEFVDRSVAYYERFFKTKIVRAPHPSLYRMLGNCVFQPPERRAVIEAAGLRAFTYSEIYGWLREDLNLGEDAWVASGVRAADSPLRRVAMRNHGPMNERHKLFYPVWDLRKAGLIELIRKAGVSLPADYRIFGRSFDGIDHRFLAPIKRHWPKDYRRILDWFPLAELELMRGKMGSE